MNFRLSLQIQIISINLENTKYKKGQDTLRRIGRFLPLVIIVIALCAFFYFHLQEYLTFAALKRHHDILSQWTRDHYVVTVVVFMLTYIFAVAISIPGATFLTLVSGFLFGIILGALYTIISATLGATLIFLAMRTALKESLAKHAKGWIHRLEKGFQANAFNYMMVLRLVPLFPFWVVNIVPALLGVSLGTYMITTFLGIMPGALVYAAVGHGLESLFETGETPDLKIIFSPQILFPLLALALLCLIPVIYKRIKKIS